MRKYLRETVKAGDLRSSIHLVVPTVFSKKKSTSMMLFEYNMQIETTQGNKMRSRVLNTS